MCYCIIIEASNADGVNDAVSVGLLSHLSYSIQGGDRFEIDTDTNGNKALQITKNIFKVMRDSSVNRRALLWVS